jgi:hypothetical protein
MMSAKSFAFRVHTSERDSPSCPGQYRLQGVRGILWRMVTRKVKGSDRDLHSEARSRHIVLVVRGIIGNLRSL